MKAYLVGWSFQREAPTVNWCDKRVIKATSSKSACEHYCEHSSPVPRNNSLAIVHCTEIENDNG